MGPQDACSEADQAAVTLRQRAAALGRRATARRGDFTPVLEYAVGDQVVALELSSVREVRVYRPFPPLPLPQPFVIGIASLHGRMLPVLDLALILRLPRAAAPPRHLVVVGRDRASFVVPAGEVFGVREISLPDAARRAALLGEVHSELVRGVTPDGRLVIDPDRLPAFLPAG